MSTYTGIRLLAMTAAIVSTLGFTSVSAQQAPLPAPMQSAESGIRGFLAPQRDVRLTSALEGRIKRIFVEPGSRVKRGQPLLSYGCDEQRAELQGARERATQRRISHETKTELFRHTAISKRDYEYSESQVNEADADVDMLAARVRKCTLIAPFSGRISDVVVKDHAHVVVGEPLIELQDDSELDVVFHVPSNWLNEKILGKVLNVRVLETGDERTAVVRKVWPNVDANSRTLKISARLDGSAAGLMAGMTAEAATEQ